MIAHIQRYIVVTTDQATAIALWVLHTHCLAACDETPYLSITSPEMRSGKTNLIKTIAMLTPRPWLVVTPSEAVTYRKIAKDQPTLFLDEVDTIWARGNEHEGLRALLNAGNQRGTTVPRIKGQSMEIVEFEVFCCKALGGIGALPATVADRSISIRMQRKTKSDVIERWRRRQVEAAAAPIKETISGVMTDAVEALTDAEPVLPDALSDRAQDHWEPLLAIAELAGGDWPRLARAAAVALANGRDDDDGSLGHRLLSDCREVFETTGAERFKTGDLIEHLVALEDAPWGDYRGKPVTGMKVAYWLKPYGIKPKHIGGFRGYQRSDFNDAWARYVRTAIEGVQGVHFQSESAITGDSKVSKNEGVDTLGNSGLPLNHAALDTLDTSHPETSGSNGSGDIQTLVCDIRRQLEQTGYRAISKSTSMTSPKRSPRTPTTRTLPSRCSKRSKPPSKSHRWRCSTSSL